LPGRHAVVPAVPDRLRVFPAASIAEGDGRVLGVKIETFAEDPKVPFVTRVSRDRASVHLISVERDQDVTLFREKDPPFLVTALPLAVHREPRRRDRPASGRLKRPDARVNSITDPARLSRLIHRPLADDRDDQVENPEDLRDVPPLRLRD